MSRLDLAPRPVDGSRVDDTTIGMIPQVTMTREHHDPITLDTLNLVAAERRLIGQAGSIHGAATLLGITRHAVKRRIIRHGIRWTRDGARITETT